MDTAIDGFSIKICDIDQHDFDTSLRYWLYGLRHFLEGIGKNEFTLRSLPPHLRENGFSQNRKCSMRGYVRTKTLQDNGSKVWEVVPCRCKIVRIERKPIFPESWGICSKECVPV
jgi:hypothetical protein